MTLCRAYLLPGGTLLNGSDSGFYETYKGVIETPTGKVRAYVKLLGLKALANEVVSTFLGQAVGLPIPHGYLVQVSSKDYPNSQALTSQGLEWTWAYGSSSADAPSLARRYNIGRNANEDPAFEDILPIWKGWPEALVFDEWISNSDRHAGNVLLGADNAVWLIDHTHAFTGPNWHSNDLKPTTPARNRIASHVQRTVSNKEKFRLKKLVSQLGSQYQEVPVADIVDKSIAPALISADDGDALKNFISERIGNLPDLILQQVGMPTLFAVG